MTAPGEEGSCPASKHQTRIISYLFERGPVGFSTIRSQRVATLEAYEDNQDISTLLHYESGVPALVERKVGSGRVLVWTSSLDWDGATSTASHFYALHAATCQLFGR